MTIEQQPEPAPKGYEHKSVGGLFNNQRILLPETGREPIIRGIYTATQIGSVAELCIAKAILIHTYFPAYLRGRDQLIRSGRVDELMQRLGL